jgi:hypothetical protein
MVVPFLQNHPILNVDHVDPKQAPQLLHLPGQVAKPGHVMRAPCQQPAVAEIAMLPPW